MESAQVTTYEPLEGRRNTNSPQMDSGPPKDRKNMVYLSLLTAGIGFVLPYNSFIIAADYWRARFPRKSVALDMSMTYITVAFATVLLNNVFLSLASFRLRISFGYAVSFTTLIFVALFEVGWHLFPLDAAYVVNLAAISLVAIGCTVQQSSFYGFASMLPKQYTQAVMAGESLAGFLVSSNRVVTKLMIQSDRVSTVIFYLTSTVYIAFSYVLHSVTLHSPFVRYHMKACATIVLRPDEDRSNETPGANRASAKYGVLAMDSNSPPQISTATLSFSNPVYELSNPTAGESVMDGLSNLPDVSSTPQQTPNVAFKVEHILTPGNCNPGRWSDFKSGLESRWRVAHSIYPYMVSIALAYCVTVSLYPGLESEIISCTLGTWMPVLLMFTFNAADVVGKMLSAVPYNWSRRQLILLSGIRTFLVPMLLLCCAPRTRPVIAGESSAFIFTIGLGVTNGLSGSLPMMMAPAKVPATMKEITGNMMTLSYNIGLLAGSLIGYVFELMLGEPLQNPCPTYPYLSVVEGINSNIAQPLNATLATLGTSVTAILTTSELPTTEMSTTSTTVSPASAIASTVLSSLGTILTQQSQQNGIPTKLTNLFSNSSTGLNEII